MDAAIIAVKRSIGTATFDGCASGSACIATSTSCATCAVPTPPITGTSDYCLQVINVDLTGSGITSISNAAYNNPFLNLTSTTIGAYAGALNQSSVVAQNWVSSAAGPTVMTAMCVK
jgi:hypothetical protein